VTPVVSDVPAAGRAARPALRPLLNDSDTPQAAMNWYGQRGQIEDANFPSPFGRGDIVSQKEMLAKTLARELQVSELDANNFIQEWAKSSNDESLPSLIIQRTASEEFEIPLSVWQQAKIEKSLADRAKELSKPGGNEMVSFPFEKRFRNGAYDGLRTEKEALDLTRKALRVMYENTQKELAAAGIDEVILYRGIELNKKLKTGEIAMNSNALESWTVAKSIASDFAGRLEGNVLGTIVSRERIFATSRTGFGCLDEWEFVVIGGGPNDIAKVIR